MMNTPQILIAYYSRRGANYVGGRIVDLAIGNTEVVANLIQQQIGGDLFQIETIQTYPADYTKTTEVAQEELRRNARPELLKRVERMEDYDLVLLGFPNWWNTMPMAVHTFLESYDFSGKTLIPFCTHEGSGMGRSESDIQKACPGARVARGLSIQGGSVHRSESAIRAWLRGAGVTH